MSNDYAKGLLKSNHIDDTDVVDVTESGLVTFKDGSQRQICEVWSRVMGYCRPFSEYNVGKKAEFESRKYFDEKKCGCNEEVAISMAAE